MWVTPASRIRAIRCISSGTPAVGSIGLGAESVSGLSRVPSPPTRMTASVSGTARACHTTRSGRGRCAECEPGGADVDIGNRHVHRRLQLDAGEGNLRAHPGGGPAGDVTGTHPPTPLGVRVVAL